MTITKGIMPTIRAIAPNTNRLSIKEAVTELTIQPSHTTIGKLLADRVRRPALDPIARQQAIENALSMALHLVRTNATTDALQRATGRVIRAASMMKQACTEATTSGRA